MPFHLGSRYLDDDSNVKVSSTIKYSVPGSEGLPHGRALVTVGWIPASNLEGGESRRESTGEGGEDSCGKTMKGCGTAPRRVSDTFPNH